MIQVSGSGIVYPGVNALLFGGLNPLFELKTRVVTIDPGGTLIVNTESGPPLLYIQEGILNDGMQLAKGIALFHAFPPDAPIVGGVRAAGAGYTANEQAMLEAVYTALQAIGLVT